MIKLLKILLGRLFKKYNELFFVGSTDILPEPLSKEEEEKYVDMFQNGDLKARDKQIMVLRYGLNDTKEYTQKEVAELLGISQSYISRIEKKVISKISSMIKI